MISNGAWSALKFSYVNHQLYGGKTPDHFYPSLRDYTIEHIDELISVGMMTEVFNMSRDDFFGQVNKVGLLWKPFAWLVYMVGYLLMGKPERIRMFKITDEGIKFYRRFKTYPRYIESTRYHNKAIDLPDKDKLLRAMKINQWAMTDRVSSEIKDEDLE